MNTKHTINQNKKTKYSVLSGVIAAGALALAALANPVPSHGESETALPEINTKTSREEDVRKIEEQRQKTFQEEYWRFRRAVEMGAEDVDLSPKFTLSADVSVAKISEHVATHIQRRREAMKATIAQTAVLGARRIAPEYSIDDDGTFSLSKTQRDQLSKLNGVIHDNAVSIQSLGIALNAMFDMSQQMYELASQEEDPDRRYQLYVDYAVLSHELSTFVADLIDSFRLEGESELEALHQHQRTKIETIRKRIEEERGSERNALEQGLIGEEDLASAEEIFDGWVEALDVCLLAWEEFTAVISEQKEMVEDARNRVGRFRKLAKWASIQLDVIEQIGRVRELTKFAHGIDRMVELSELPLLSLDAETARSLIGDLPD